MLDNEHEHPSRWAAILSIASKIGCTGQTPNEWMRKADVDAGKRAGVPTDIAARLKALKASISGRMADLSSCFSDLKQFSRLGAK